MADVDLAAAHRHFAAHCFNATWSLIERQGRTPADDDQMVRLAMASHYHWTQRSDYGPQPESIAQWQLSRVFAILGQADNARRHGTLALEAARAGGLVPFYVAYGFEALARAEAVGGNPGQATLYLAEARNLATTLERDREQLVADLDEVERLVSTGVA